MNDRCWMPWRRRGVDHGGHATGLRRRRGWGRIPGGAVGARGGLSVASRSAVPVEAECGGVVSESSSAGLDGGLDELLDGFAGVLGAGVDEHGADVDAGGFALE